MMRRTALVLSSVSLCLWASGYAAAQGWNTQARNADEASEQEAQPEGLKDNNGQLLGWQNLREAVDPTTLDRPMTELERLSQSPSGAGFSADFYDAKSDNPLVPVSVVLRALDKITAQYTDLDVKIGNVQDFGALQIMPRTCDKRPPEEIPETTAFLEVYDNSPQPENASQAAKTLTATEAGTVEDTRSDTVPDSTLEEMPEDRSEAIIEPEVADMPVTDMATDVIVEEQAVPMPDGENLFRGWMFASSPALNALEHPVYDVWVIDCKMVEPDKG